MEAEQSEEPGSTSRPLVSDATDRMYTMKPGCSVGGGLLEEGAAVRHNHCQVQGARWARPGTDPMGKCLN
eukprot:16412198-Heterocapsa_arctica.AAC.1